MLRNKQQTILKEGNVLFQNNNKTNTLIGPRYIPLFLIFYLCASYLITMGSLNEKELGIHKKPNDVKKKAERKGTRKFSDVES